MKLKQKLLDCNPFDKDSSLRNVVTCVVANDDVNVHDYEAVGKAIVQKMVLNSYSRDFLSCHKLVI